MSKILVIEDQPETLDNLGTMLEMEGYDVLRAPNGRIGLDVARREKPDLILCDISMPELDGYGVLEALRASPETVGVSFIFLSAKGEKQDLRTGMNLGADDYLSKPAAAAEVLDAVRIRLDRHRQHAQATLRRADAGPDFTSSQPLERLGLTPREAEVLLWIAQGKANADIASILGCAENTVKVHSAHIFEKLGVENRNAAALKAIEALRGRG